MTENSNRELATISDKSSGITPTPSPYKKKKSKQALDPKQLHSYFVLIEKIVFFLILMNIIRIVMNDISERINDQINDNNYAQEDARAKYLKMKCKEGKYSGLDKECEDIDRIAHSNPQSVEKLRISVRYISSLLNDFVNPLSPKTLLLLLLIFALFQLKP